MMKSRLAIIFALVIAIPLSLMSGSQAATPAAKPTPSTTPTPAPVAPTNVGAYFKVEIGYMVSWSQFQL